MTWQNNGNSTKSNSEMDGLTRILQQPDFDTAIEIKVPSGSPQIPSKKFKIPQLLYRNPLSVICAAFADRLASQFHFAPFKLFQEIDGDDGETISQRVQTNIYNSDVFLEEHKNLRRAPTDDKDCKREKVVAALMCCFGTAKLWPIYMLFGAVHHLAYIPTIPDSVKHEISKFNISLNDAFLHAYKYGIVIKCFDGVECRVYPWFFTYLADYPEKVLLATIRKRGLCPCPHCLCPKEALDRMGLHQDMKMRDKLRVFLHDKVKLTREWIYKQGVKIQGSAVQCILKATSSVPTMNAFIGRLGLDFNLSRMLVVDLMHEFEVGVWKALFSHLI
ncbi:hypothetical protein F5877DRAFT_93236 [Lentinula edodes]|nr:hypothetical protein F5877DRAFT_93236 [Lentinula edodes]